MLEKQGKPLGIPDCDGGEYLLRVMMRLGPTRWGFDQEIPTGWPEIEAFGRATGLITYGWEATAIFDMCRGYLSAKVAGTSGLAIAPVEQDGG